MFFHIFTIANQLPGFSISRLANVEDFLNVIIFFNCKCKCKHNNFSFKYICVVYYLKLCFYCLTWSVYDFRDFGFALDLLHRDIRTFCLFPGRLEEVFKTCLQEVLKTCLQDILKTSSA